MGMFDYVQCDYPLPSEEKPTIKTERFNAVEFQTKDTACRMDKYTIELNGNLMIERDWGVGDYETAPKEKSDYTGWMTFYTSEGHPLFPDYKWFEYEAEFFRGQLHCIKGGVTQRGRRRSDEECDQLIASNPALRSNK